MDILYIGIVLVFFLLTWGLLKGCDLLFAEKIASLQEAPGEQKEHEYDADIEDVHGYFTSGRERISSNAKFSRNTFTRGSPRNPNCLHSVYRSTRDRILSSVIPRTLATRGSW